MYSDNDDDYLYVDPEIKEQKLALLTLLVPQLFNNDDFLKDKKNISFIVRGCFSTQKEVNSRIELLNSQNIDDYNKVTLPVGNWLAYDEDAPDENLAFGKEAGDKLNSNIFHLYEAIDRDKKKLLKKVDEEKNKTLTKEHDIEIMKDAKKIHFSKEEIINKNLQEINELKEYNDIEDKKDIESGILQEEIQEEIQEEKETTQEPFLLNQEVVIVSVVTKDTILKIDETIGDKLHNVRGLKIRCSCKESEIEETIKKFSEIDEYMEFFPIKLGHIKYWTDNVKDIEEYISPVDNINNLEMNIPTPGLTTKKEAEIYKAKKEEIEKNRKREQRRKFTQMPEISISLNEKDYDEVKMRKIVYDLIMKSLNTCLDENGDLKLLSNYDKFKENSKLSTEMLDVYEKRKEEVDNNIKMINEQRAQKLKEIEDMEKEIKNAKELVKKLNKNKK